MTELQYKLTIDSMLNSEFLSRLDLVTQDELKDDARTAFDNITASVQSFSKTKEAQKFLKNSKYVSPKDAHVLNLGREDQAKFHFRLYRISSPSQFYSPEGSPLYFLSSLDSNTIIPLGYGARKYFYFENGEDSQKKQSANSANVPGDASGSASDSSGTGCLPNLFKLPQWLMNLLALIRQLFSGNGANGGGCGNVLSRLLKFLMALLLLALLILLLMNLKECSKSSFKDALKSKQVDDELAELEKKKKQFADQVKAQDEMERNEALQRNNARIREERRRKLKAEAKESKAGSGSQPGASGEMEAAGSAGTAGPGDEQDKFLKTIAFYGQSVNADTLSRSSIKWDDMTDEDFDKATPKFRKRIEEFCDEQLKEGNDCYRDQIKRVDGNRLYKTFGKKIKSIRQGKEEE